MCPGAFQDIHCAEPLPRDMQSWVEVPPGQLRFLAASWRRFKRRMKKAEEERQVGPAVHAAPALPAALLAAPHQLCWHTAMALPG